MQQFLTTDRERSRVFEERERDAYVTFLTALHKSRMAAVEYKGGHTENARMLNLEYELEATAAVRRIAVYGDERVVKAVARWSRRSPDLLPCDENTRVLVAITKEMRDVTRPDQSMSEADLAPLAHFCSMEPR